jgi:hypothetical protein
MQPPLTSMPSEPNVFEGDKLNAANEEIQNGLANGILDLLSATTACAIMAVIDPVSGATKIMVTVPRSVDGHAPGELIPQTLMRQAEHVAEFLIEARKQKASGDGGT